MVAEDSLDRDRDKQEETETWSFAGGEPVAPTRIVGRSLRALEAVPVIGPEFRPQNRSKCRSGSSCSKRDSWVG